MSTKEEISLAKQAIVDKTIRFVIMNLAESKNMLRSLAAEIIGLFPVERFLDSRVAYLETLKARAARKRATMATSPFGFDPREMSAAEDNESLADRTVRILGLTAQALRSANLEIGDGGLKIAAPEARDSAGVGNS